MYTREEGVEPTQQRDAKHQGSYSKYVYQRTIYDKHKKSQHAGREP